MSETELKFVFTLNNRASEKALKLEVAALKQPWHECVGTILQLAENEFWAGLHWPGPFLSPAPSDESILKMPSDSPSRAWLKLEEAMRFFGQNFSPKDVCAAVSNRTGMGGKKAPSAARLFRFSGTAARRVSYIRDKEFLERSFSSTATVDKALSRLVSSCVRICPRRRPRQTEPACR